MRTTSSARRELKTTPASSRIQALLKKFLRNESGQDLVEYALLVALIAMGATASMSTLATSFSTAFSKVGSHFATYTT
jgi:pilus assembly protein Flp/PilA